MEPGRLGVWVVGEPGALLVRPGGRRVHAYCVGVKDADLPRSDRVAHLLLALRQDEKGFATVANHAFAGATWRVRRRLRSTGGQRSTRGSRPRWVRPGLPERGARQANAAGSSRRRFDVTRSTR